MKKKKMKKQLTRNAVQIAELQNKVEQQAKLVCRLTEEREALITNNGSLEEQVSDMTENCKSMEESLRCMYTVVEMLKEDKKDTMHLMPKKVIQSAKNGTTIVLWEDGVRTEAKVGAKDTFNPVAGLAVSYLRRILAPKVYDQIFLRGEYDLLDQDQAKADKDAAKVETKKAEPDNTETGEPATEQPEETTKDSVKKGSKK